MSLTAGCSCVPRAGVDPLCDADPPRQGLHPRLHTVLHEEGGDAGGGPAERLRRDAVQGVCV